jgi:4-hydroxybenzoate polyprenyltransferase and related prenyltransferases
VNKYLELFRLQNGAIGVIGILASSFIAAGRDIADHWLNIVVAVAIIVIFMGGGNALNDYIDRDIDVVSHPERPVPSGRMKAEHALYAGCAMLLVSVLMSIVFWDALSIAIVIIACVLMFAYELALKQRGLAGNVTIAVQTGMIFLLGGAIVDNISGVYVLAGMAMLVNIGREITKDIEDMEGDIGRSTLPMKIGKRKAGIVAAIFFIAGPVLSIWPIIDGMFSSLYLTVIIPDAMFIYASYILFDNPHRAQKVAKFAMLVALGAFILGVI